MKEYPTTEQLKTIENFPMKYNDSWEQLLKYIHDLWEYPNYFTIGTKYITMVTGGWSGNEEIIAALSENYIAWSLYWYDSKRGGKYRFLKRRDK